MPSSMRMTSAFLQVPDRTGAGRVPRSASRQLSGAQRCQKSRDYEFLFKTSVVLDSLQIYRNAAKVVHVVPNYPSPRSPTVNVSHRRACSPQVRRGGLAPWALTEPSSLYFASCYISIRLLLHDPIPGSPLHLAVTRS